MKIAAWVGGAVALAVVALLVIGAMTPQRTYAEVAELDAAKCVDQRAVGTGWTASSGLDLELFCKTRAYAKASARLCENNPDGC